MFRTDADMARADWELIAHGAVTLFWRKALFEQTKQSLRLLDYRLVEVGCQTRSRATEELGSGLNWMDQFGYAPWTGNLDALNDGLRSPPYSSADSLAVCFEDFHHLVAEDPGLALGMLDVFERQSRDQLLLGRRLLALVQTDDGSFFTGKLGGHNAGWNRAEWMNSTRMS